MKIANFRLQISKVVHENYVGASPNVPWNGALLRRGNQHLESPIVSKHRNIINQPPCDAVCSSSFAGFLAVNLASLVVTGLKRLALAEKTPTATRLRIAAACSRIVVINSIGGLKRRERCQYLVKMLLPGTPTNIVLLTNRDQFDLGSLQDEVIR